MQFPTSQHSSPEGPFNRADKCALEGSPTNLVPFHSFSNLRDLQGPLEAMAEQKVGTGEELELYNKNAQLLQDEATLGVENVSITMIVTI